MFRQDPFLWTEHSSVIGREVMRDRKRLAQDGVLIAIMPYDLKERRWFGDVQVRSRGFALVDESDALIEQARALVLRTLEKKIADGQYDGEKINASVRNALASFMVTQTGRKPLVLPIIVNPVEES